jgi:hypothetical protein
MKQHVTILLEKEVIKQMKITMAELELKNQSHLIETLLKEWVVKNSK